MLYKISWAVSLDYGPKYDFSKKGAAKLESTCKLAWPFVILEKFRDFSKVLVQSGKVYGCDRYR